MATQAFSLFVCLFEFIFFRMYTFSYFLFFMSQIKIVKILYFVFNLVLITYKGILQKDKCKGRSYLFLRTD